MVSGLVVWIRELWSRVVVRMVRGVKWCMGFFLL